MPYFNIKSFNKGISDYDDRGVPGSAKFTTNLDLRKKTDSLTCQQAFKKLTGVSLSANIIEWVTAPNSFALYGFHEFGKIISIDYFTQILTLVYQDPDADIRGASLSYKSDGTVWLVWATANKLKKKVLPGLSDWSDVITVATDLDFGGSGPFTNHYMKQIDDSIYVCNDSHIGVLDYTHTWNAQAFDLLPFHRAKTIHELDNYILIGADVTDNSQRSYLYSWDGESDRYTRKRRLATSGLNTLVTTEQTYFVCKGAIYTTDIVNNTSSVPLRILNEEFHSLAVSGSNENKGLALFAVTSLNTEQTGIYSFGRNRLGESPILTLDYHVEGWETMGALTVYRDEIYVSTRVSGELPSVYTIDLSNKAVGTYEGLDLKSPTDKIEESSLWTKIRLITKEMPTGTKINCYYRPNKTGEYIQAKLNNGEYDFTVGTEAIFMIDCYADIFDYKIVLTPNGNETPEVFNIKVFFE